MDITPDGFDSIARFYSPLSPEETEVLQALQEYRRRQEQPEQREQRVRGQEGPPTLSSRSLWAERLSRSSQPSESASSGSSARPAGERSASGSRRIIDINGSIQRAQLRIQQERQERLNRDEISRQLNRELNARGENTAGTERRRAPEPPSVYRRSDGVSAPFSDTGTSNATRERQLRVQLAAAYPEHFNSVLAAVGVLRNDPDSINFTQPASNTRDDTAGGTGDSSSSPSPYEGYRPSLGSDFRRRERAAYLLREWDNNPSRRLERFLSRGNEPAAPHPHDTSGLAWSADGQILYVGADDGIYEFHVNRRGQKSFSSVTPR